MKTMKKGFTLIELIVVIAIIAILALILVPQVTGYINNANESADKASAKTCYTSALANWTSVESGLESGAISVDDDCTLLPNTATNDGTGDMPTGASFGDDGWTYTGSTGEFTQPS